MSGANAGPLEVEDFDKELDRIVNYLESAPMDNALRSCREKLFVAFAANFHDASTADGSPWPKRKDPIPQHPLLILSESLFNSVVNSGEGHVERVGDREMEVGTDIVYAATHQYGDPARNISQREYLAITEQTADELVGIVGGIIDTEMS